MPCCLGVTPVDRRTLLRQIAALGGAAALPGLAKAALFPEGELVDEVSALFDAAGGAELGAVYPFRITGETLPWTTQPVGVQAGQQVTFLVSGRWYLARPIDLWVEPGMVLFARTPGSGMYSPMKNAGTMTVEHTGPLELARSAGEWASPDGVLWTPQDVYQQADGLIDGVAIVWNGEPLAGLNRILQHGNPGGLVSMARDRLLTPDVTPEGWKNHHSFGESGVFRKAGNQMLCDTHKTVAILQKDVDLDLSEDLRLDWQWLVDELPSQVAEDQVPTHDYLSIGVEFDDGQDITYLWSAALDTGHVFRCPLPGWNAVETHVVQRTGFDDLGKWLKESRMVSEDYHAFIGGSATRAVRVWLLGVSVFQRRSGACRYADISIGGAEPGTRKQLV